MRLTRGRVSVLGALAIIADEETCPDFRETVSGITRALEKGMPLSEAIAEYPEVFSLAMRELIRAAEQSGAWDEILLEIADGLSEGTFD